ncbi:MULTISPECIES: helix-turn-helix transcriptional regulator [unclassified Halomonas]|uniref:helix-turn-helix transcriptional regulator n=1 Tax=unclassified Halomonas TaxID=2609666 RepID=UPI0004836E6B|nr:MULTISPECIES: WYL domain-containing protein [unclassified Halomonas]
MNEGPLGLRRGVERRLRFIEFRLYWEGGINRGDIIGFFGVSVPQASKDLSQYQELAPGNMAYDKSEKRYFAADTFQPRFLTPDPNQYLSQLRQIAEKDKTVEETWLSNFPNLDCLPIPHRRIDPEVLRKILSAVRNNEAIEIHYQSMNPNRPDPVWRSISPHALASDGFRWHVRAYCHIDHKFKDFLLSRCLDCRQSGKAKAGGKDDQMWQTFFIVKLTPNPKLSKSQQAIIASDYAMDDHVIDIPVRKSFLYYFKKRLRLDIADLIDRPEEIPVVVANREEFEQAMKQTLL